MKQIYFILTVVAVLMSSCRQEDLQQGSKGWLAVESLSVQRATEVQVDVTRAADADLNVDIYNAEGTLVHQYAAGDAEGLRTIALDAGDYTLKAYTTNYNTIYGDTELGAAKYSVECPFAIKAGMLNKIEVKVPMTNLGVQFLFPDELATWFPALALTVTLGDRSVALNRGETAYFELPAESEKASFAYTLNGTNTDGEAFSQSGTYPDASAGTVYTVTYSLATRSWVVE